MNEMFDVSGSIFYEYFYEKEREGSVTCIIKNHSPVFQQIIRYFLETSYIYNKNNEEILRNLEVIKSILFYFSSVLFFIVLMYHLNIPIV